MDARVLCLGSWGSGGFNGAHDVRATEVPQCGLVSVCHVGVVQTSELSAGENHGIRGGRGLRILLGLEVEMEVLEEERDLLKIAQGQIRCAPADTQADCICLPRCQSPELCFSAQKLSV